jgi:hypothetical protein
MKTTLLSLSAAAFVAIGAMALHASPARAEVEHPWCSFASVTGGGGNCYFATLEQCQASIPGGSGFCQPNARASAMASAPAPRAKRATR